MVEFINNVPKERLTKQKLKCIDDLVHSKLFAMPGKLVLVMRVLEITLYYIDKQLYLVEFGLGVFLGLCHSCFNEKLYISKVKKYFWISQTNMMIFGVSIQFVEFISEINDRKSRSRFLVLSGEFWNSFSNEDKFLYRMSPYSSSHDASAYTHPDGTTGGDGGLYWSSLQHTKSYVFQRNGEGKVLKLTLIIQRNYSFEMKEDLYFKHH